jgi:hypothetical protein
VVVYGPTWGDAEARAVQLGGHLVKIDNAEENEFLVSTFQPTLGNYGFWIGATDQETEGVWKWSDGTPVSYTNWGPSEPNNTYIDGGEEDHGQIVYPINGNPGYGSVGRWNDTRESTADRPIGGWPYTTAGIAEIPLTSPDTEVPVITLIGDNPMDIYKGSGFNDPSATVTDNVDAVRTITGSGTVDVSILCAEKGDDGFTSKLLSVVRLGNIGGNLIDELMADVIIQNYNINTPLSELHRIELVSLCEKLKIKMCKDIIVDSVTNFKLPILSKSNDERTKGVIKRMCKGNEKECRNGDYKSR